MQAQIDGPVAVSINPAREGHSESVTLQVLGGNLWFRRDLAPSNLTPGHFKIAVVELALRVLRVGERSQTCYLPVRLVEVR